MVTSAASCRTQKYRPVTIVAETHADDSESIAWKNRDRYEQDLINLGWTLALEDHPAGPEQNTRATLGAKVDALMLDTQK